MPLYKIKLLDRQEVAQGTVLFTFEKPAGFTFKPGQYGGFTLIDAKETDANGMTRRFSLLSTPDDAHIAIATRLFAVTHAFKRVLNALPLGSEVKFAGPTGAFTLHEDITIPAVFIAGGIGISPFYSMIRHGAQHRIPQSLTLFYGNPTPTHAAFLNELVELHKTHTHFKCVATMDKVDAADWSGETGFISTSMIKKYVPDLSVPFYYICGSPVMVTAMQELLVEMGIDEDKIRVEDFPGY